jgi:hypothetical protein
VKKALSTIVLKELPVSLWQKSQSNPDWILNNAIGFWWKVDFLGGIDYRGERLAVQPKDSIALKLAETRLDFPELSRNISHTVTSCLLRTQHQKTNWLLTFC